LPTRIGVYSAELQDARDRLSERLADLGALL